MAEPLFFNAGTTGLTASLGYRFFDVNGDWAGARITSGIFEQDALAGVYGVAAATIPATARGVHWDTSPATSVFGTEFFDATGFATISAAVSGLGNGAYPITITVKDDQGTPVVIPSATVRLTQGALTYSGTTDASGNISFSLDAATYTVSITKGGYSFTPTTRTVTGSQAGTLVTVLTMVANLSIPAAPGPNLSTLYGTLYKPDGTKAANIPITATIVVPRSAAVEAAGVISGRTAQATTDSVGYFEMDLIRTDGMLPDGCTYTVACVAAGLEVKRVTLTADTKDIASLIN